MDNQEMRDATLRKILRSITVNLVLLWAIVIASVLLAERAKGQDELTILEADYSSFEWYKVGNNRDEYLRINDPDSQKYGEGGESWQYGAAMRLNLNLLSYGDYGLYWKNRVHMAATECCVRHVGWEYEVGAKVTPHFDLFHYHHSEHILDLGRQASRFPLVNHYGVRFIFIEGDRK